MSQAPDPFDLQADQDLGQRLHQVLLDRPGLNPQQLLNLVRDLMGEADSLFPAFRVLATQPCFAELLRVSSGPAARPHLDAVLAFARQTLAPAMVTRLECTLLAACGLDGIPEMTTAQLVQSLPVALQSPMAATGRAETGTVVAGSGSGLVSEPGTVLATNFRPPTSATGSQIPETASMPSWSLLQRSLRALLLALVLLFGIYGVLRSPWLCEAFDLCSTEETPAANEKPTPKASPATTVQPEPARTVAPPPAPVPARPAAPRRVSLPTPAPAPATPAANDPLWD